MKKLLEGVGLIMLLILPILMAGCGKGKPKEPEKPVLKVGDIQKLKARIASSYYIVKDIKDDGTTVQIKLSFPPKPPADVMIANITNETCENAVIYLGKTKFRGRGVWITAIAIDTTNIERTVGKSVYDPTTNEIKWEDVKK